VGAVVAEHKVGVLGGTFDPVHMGHLIVAEEVRQKLGLHEVLFIPAGEPSLKEGKGVSEAGHRLEMTILATSSNPYLNVSTIEIERPGPSYSVDTVIELRAGLGAGARLYFIAGYDRGTMPCPSFTSGRTPGAWLRRARWWPWRARAIPGWISARWSMPSAAHPKAS